MRHRRRAAVVASMVIGSVAVSIGTVDVARAADTDVVINEIMYHPEDDDPNAEFVELFNRGSSTVDISNWCIDGVKYCFPAGATIGGGAFRVVTSASFGGALSNGVADIQAYFIPGAFDDIVDSRLVDTRAR